MYATVPSSALISTILTKLCCFKRDNHTRFNVIKEAATINHVDSLSVSSMKKKILFQLQRMFKVSSAGL